MNHEAKSIEYMSPKEFIDELSKILGTEYLIQLDKSLEKFIIREKVPCHD